MGARNERHMTRHGNQYGATHRFRVKPLPASFEAPDALVAKKCACENPQTYEDEDGERRCLCGRAI